MDIFIDHHSIRPYFRVTVMHTNGMQIKYPIAHMPNMEYLLLAVEGDPNGYPSFPATFIGQHMTSVYTPPEFSRAYLVAKREHVYVWANDMIPVTTQIGRGRVAFLTYGWQ
ncbi:hypothetical protein ACH5RR_021258 [Cinchona calisaya]|uniref:Uncharacterized protein n=1 Tax=Cinchona calisaya TaxID=153742 RepID=A0ABD2ZGU0_9GENT